MNLKAFHCLLIIFSLITCISCSSHTNSDELWDQYTTVFGPRLNQIFSSRDTLRHVVNDQVNVLDDTHVSQVACANYSVGHALGKP